MQNIKSFTLQRTSTGVDIFFSLIFSYFCFLVAALPTWKVKKTDCKVSEDRDKSHFVARQLMADGKNLNKQVL